MNMNTWLTILIVILILLGLWFIATYNKFIRQIEAINNNLRQIDIQLDRRFKVFQSLIEVVKKYMDYEKTTLKDVVALRNQAKQAAGAGDTQGKITAENAISRIASSINLVFEQYPDLKANQNALQLQEEIVNTENKLTYAKQAYNDSIETYNALKKSFLQSFVITLSAAKLDKEFSYWQLPEAEKERREAYTVKL